MHKIWKYFSKKDQLQQILDINAMKNKNVQLDFNQIKKISLYLQNPQQQNRLLLIFLKQLHSQHWIIKLKFHILFHYILICNHHKNTLISPFIEMYSVTHTFKQFDKLNDEADYKSLQQWCHSKIIDHYIQYLVKFCKSINIYSEILRLKKIKVDNLQQQSFLRNCQTILEMINFILESKTNLMKFGRYFKQYIIIVDLYTMYLKDLGVYYQFLKRTAESIIQNYKSVNKDLQNNYFEILNEIQMTTSKIEDYFAIKYFSYEIRNVAYPKFLKMDQKRYQQISQYIDLINKKQLKSNKIKDYQENTQTTIIAFQNKLHKQQ